MPGSILRPQRVHVWSRPGTLGRHSPALLTQLPAQVATVTDVHIGTPSTSSFLKLWCALDPCPSQDGSVQHQADGHAGDVFAQGRDRLSVQPQSSLVL